VLKLQEYSGYMDKIMVRVMGWDKKRVEVIKALDEF
jgi:hypothetical protein